MSIERAKELGLCHGEYWVEWMNEDTVADSVHIIKARDAMDAAREAAGYFDRSSELDELRVQVISWNGDFNTVDLEARCVKEWDAKLVRI